jgi:hypothetical protein
MRGPAVMYNSSHNISTLLRCYLLLRSSQSWAFSARRIRITFGAVGAVRGEGDTAKRAVSTQHSLTSVH